MADAQYYYSGQSGAFYYDGANNAAGTCRDWSFTCSMATLDATTLGDTYKVPVSGIRTITGSATLFWAADGADNRDKIGGDIAKWLITPRGNTTNQKNPGEAAEAGGNTPYVRLRLRVEGAGGQTGNHPGRGMDLMVKFTNVAMTMAHGEIFAANVTWESVGAPEMINL